MKIKKFESKQILKLYLLKSRTYENFIKKKNSSFLDNTNLIEIITNFKRALHVIFSYHRINKKILFIGLPKKLELRINRLTHHVAVPKNFDLQGLIFNTKSKSFKFLKPSRYNFLLKALLPKLSKKPDLVVFFSSEYQQNILSEVYLSKTPLIIFNNTSRLNNTSWLTNSYIIQGIEHDLHSIHFKNLFFIGLNFLFKTLSKKNITSQLTYNKMIHFKT